MKNKFLKLSIPFIFLLSACYKNHPVTIIENEVIEEHAQNAYKKKGLIVTGTGSEGPTDVISLTIYYTSYEKGSIKKARKYFFDLSDDLVKNMNDNLKIRPHLREFPCTYRHAKIVLSFYDKETNRPYMEGSISRVQMIDGKLYYGTFDLVNCWQIVYEEDLEEAKKLVQLDPV